MKELFVTCASNLELLLSQELKNLNISSRKGFRGVFAPKTIDNVYAINYRSRLATRVLWPLAQFPCRDRHDLYKAAKAIDWAPFLSLDKTFAIDANVSHPEFRNTLFAAFVVKDAICDQFRDRLGARPSVDTANPDIQLNLFIHGGQATLSFDTSGAPLYKRGYRQESGPAPLQESLAAAILQFAQYTPDDILLDPFCGSGTFLIEAAMSATHTPAGYFRKKWGFFHMPTYDSAAFLALKTDADALICPLPPNKIFGSDKNPKTALPFPIPISTHEIKGLHPPQTPTLVVANPPYGKRLALVEQTYRDLGTALRTWRCRAAVLIPDPALARLLAGRFKQKIPLSNGGLDITLYLL